MRKSDIELYLTKKVQVNYVSTGGDVLEAIVNSVVSFKYDKQTKNLSIYLRDTVGKRTKNRLFKELKHVGITGGHNLHELATEWYTNHLDELRIFAEGR